VKLRNFFVKLRSFLLAAYYPRPFVEDMPRIMRHGRWFVLGAMLLAIYVAPQPVKSLVLLAGLTIISATYWAMYFSARRRRARRRRQIG
jgi:hypothetical protein